MTAPPSAFLAGSNARIYFHRHLPACSPSAVIIALATKFISGPLARWSIVMVTAGGLSNCIDRVIYGYVQDMFKCEFVNFPIFNVADIFITVFCLLFILYIIFGGNKRGGRGRDEDEDEDDEDDSTTRMRTTRTKSLSRRAAPQGREGRAAPPTRARQTKRPREEDEAEPAKRASPARSPPEQEATSSQAPARSPRPPRAEAPRARQRRRARPSRRSR